MARKNAAPAPPRSARDSVDALHPADRALWLNSKEGLPDELHAGYDAVVASFAHYERGEDDDVRSVLEPIGLRSPFLEWKVLLRALMAHATNDDARAAENFARLNPDRLPYRLAEPYRAKVDASFQPPNRDALLKRHEKLNTNGVVESLREVAKHLGREKPLKTALRAAGDAVALLKKIAPQLLQRLSACLQQAIIRQGEPEDLAAFRKLFPPPADDPSFFKLQGRIAEEIGKQDVAVQNWKAYEAWLESKPAGWPEPLRERVRASIWHHMGALQESDNAVAAAESCFRRALELAPDWIVPARDLFSTLSDRGRYAEAEQVARAILVHQPDSIEAVLALANNLRNQKRHDDALEFFRRALAINPLDSTVALQTALAVLASARHRLFAGRAEEARDLLDSSPEVKQPRLSSHVNALQSVVARKLGDDEAAARHLGSLDVRQRLADTFRIAVDSQLAKLKPAARKAADAAFAAAFAEPIGPLALVNLLLAWELYQNEGTVYRGQKTQEKKFFNMVADTLAAADPEREFEALARHLADSRHEKIAKKYLDKCITRFPKNPHFLVLQAELGLRTETPNWTMESWLLRAKELAEKSKVERDRNLLPRINELLRQVPNPYAFLDSFFSGGV